MANDQQPQRPMERSQASVSEEEQKRINIGLRGGKNVDAQREERGELNENPEQGGAAGDELSREYGTAEELKSASAKKGGRRGGRSHH